METREPRQKAQIWGTLLFALSWWILIKTLWCHALKTVQCFCLLLLFEMFLSDVRGGWNEGGVLWKCHPSLSLYDVYGFPTVVISVCYVIIRAIIYSTHVHLWGPVETSCKTTPLYNISIIYYQSMLNCPQTAVLWAHCLLLLPSYSGSL